MRNRIVLTNGKSVDLATTIVAGVPTLNVVSSGGGGGGGDASAANQLLGNASLASIDTKTPSLGQALAAASTPVVLTAAQIATLTPLSTVAVTGTFFQATQPVSIAGTVAVSGPLTDTQLRATAVPVSGAISFTAPQHIIVDSGTITSITNALPAGSNVIGHVIIDSGSTTSVTGNVTVVQSTSTNLKADITIAASQTLATVTTITNPVTVIGNKTNNNADPGATNIGSLGAVANAATPSFTEGNQVALSVDLSGNLRTSASITPTVDSAPATQNITAQDTGSSTSTGANGQSFVTGSATANSTASFTVSSEETLKVQVTGTWTGTLAVEHSFDSGTTWVSSGVHQPGTAYTSNNFTENFIGGNNISGATNVRVRSTGVWTGTATVKIIASVNNNSIYVANGISIQDSTIATNKFKILSASTAASSTDTAGVVALSPNSSLPTGTNLVGSFNLNSDTSGNMMKMIDLLSEILRETRATRLATSSWMAEAVTGYSISDFDPHNIQKQLE